MKRIIYACLAVCVVLMLACDRWRARPIRIGICPWPGYDMILLAYEKGFFRQEGVAVQLLKRGGTIETKNDFVEGRIDIAALPLLEAMALIEQGEDIVIPLVLDYSKGADGVVIKKSLAGFNGIKRQKIGVSLGTINYYILNKALEKNGLSEADVDIIDIDPDEMVEAFAEGRVSALAIWEPYLSKASREGAGMISFTSRDLSVPVVDVLAVRRTFAAGRSADLRKIVRAWVKTIAYFKNNYPEAVQVLSDLEGVSPDVVKAGFEGVQIGDLTVNREAFGDGRSFGSIFTALDEMGAFMRAKKMTKGNTDFRKCIQPQFFFESQ